MPHLVSAGLLATFLAAPGLLAQSPVPVHREPRHRLVWEEGPVRVLDVRIAPGDTTLFHIHDMPMLYVRVADTSYALRPVTHRVTNVGTTPFRLIGIMNAGPGTAREARAPSSDLPGALEQASSWFQASRLVLQPAVGIPSHTASTPLIIVQPGGGRVHAEREG